MKSVPLSKLIASEHATFKHVIGVIDRAGQRIAYIVNDDAELVGVITDSEIRQALLAGSDRKSQIYEIINRNPIILTEENVKHPFVAKKTARELLKLMPDCEHILVVDKKNRPQKLIPLSSLIGREVFFKKTHERRYKKVLVVGGAGYLGSVLVKKLLKKGHFVRILDLMLYGISPIKDYLSHPNIDVIEGDIRNLSLMARILEDIDVVINLAAVVGDPACKSLPRATIETNYLANKSLADACKYHQINRFIFASTCSVYGQMKGNDKLDENAPLHPVSLYARSKIESEEGILALEDENFSPTILRLSTLFGYSTRMRFDLVVNTMVKTAFAEKQIIVKNGGKQWRPILHVGDAARAFISVIEAPLSKVKGEVFNVGSEEQNTRILDIAKRVHKQFPDSSLVIEDSTDDPRNYFVSFQRISSQLQFITKKTIDDGIMEIKRNLERGIIKNVSDKIYYNDKLSLEL